MKIYQVKDWSLHYENNKSRERIECSYVCIPNSQHGLGFSRIMAQKDGAAIYGIWCLLLGSLSRQKRVDDKGRIGWLTDDGHQAGTPWQASDLALVWRRQTSEVQRALDFLSSPAIGWIVSYESVDSSLVMKDGHHAGTKCPSSALEEKRREEKRREAPAAIDLIPLNLRNENFQVSWANWVMHRKCMRKPLTPQAVEAQLKECEEWGLEKSIASIEKSIKSGWQGLFETDQKGQFLASKKLIPLPGPSQYQPRESVS